MVSATQEMGQLYLVTEAELHRIEQCEQATREEVRRLAATIRAAMWALEETSRALAEVDVAGDERRHHMHVLSRARGLARLLDYH